MQRLTGTLLLGAMLVLRAAPAWAATPLPAADPTSETRTTYLQGDVVGNTRVEIGQDGTQMTAHRYEPFGLVLPSENMPAEAPRFSGKLRDPATGLDDFGARHFAAQYGRFLSTDPAAFGSKTFANPQDLNLYVYAMNNPFAYGDPTGRENELLFALLGRMRTYMKQHTPNIYQQELHRPGYNCTGRAYAVGQLFGHHFDMRQHPTGLTMFRQLTSVAVPNPAFGSENMQVEAGRYAWFLVNKNDGITREEQERAYQKFVEELPEGTVLLIGQAHHMSYVSDYALSDQFGQRLSSEVGHAGVMVKEAGNLWEVRSEVKDDNGIVWSKIHRPDFKRIESKDQDVFEGLQKRDLYAFAVIGRFADPAHPETSELLHLDPLGNDDACGGP